MARLKVCIRKQDSEKAKDGTYNIKIRVTHKSKVRYIGTDVNIQEDQIDNGEIINHPSSSLYNIKLRNILNLYEQKIIDLGGRIFHMDAQAITTYLRKVDVKGRDSDFYFLAGKIISDLNKAGRIKYAQSIEYTLSDLKGFSGPSLLFDEVTPEYLERFGTHQRIKKKGVNTTAIHYRNIRMIYNRAIDSEKADLSMYPFRRFKIKQAPTPDKDMDLEDLRKLRDAELKLKAQKRARDLFMLSFYMCGINFKDLLYAQKSDIRKGRLNQPRIKTKQPLSVKIMPEAQEIINRYAGGKYLLKFIEVKKKTTNRSRKSILHTDILSQVNIKLKDIAKALEIPYKLSTYYARHTWSSIAFNECGASEEIIGLALGHASPRQITAGYIKKKYDQVDRVNRAVIDLLSSSGEPSYPDPQ